MIVRPRRQIWRELHQPWEHFLLKNLWRPETSAAVGARAPAAFMWHKCGWDLTKDSFKDVEPDQGSKAHYACRQLCIWLLSSPTWDWTVTQWPIAILSDGASIHKGTISTSSKNGRFLGFMFLRLWETFQIQCSHFQGKLRTARLGREESQLQRNLESWNVIPQVWGEELWRAQSSSLLSSFLWYMNSFGSSSVV